MWMSYRRGFRSIGMKKHDFGAYMCTTGLEEGHVKRRFTSSLIFITRGEEGSGKGGKVWIKICGERFERTAGVICLTPVLSLAASSPFNFDTGWGCMQRAGQMVSRLVPLNHLVLPISCLAYSFLPRHCVDSKVGLEQKPRCVKSFASLLTTPRPYTPSTIWRWAEQR